MTAHTTARLEPPHRPWRWTALAVVAAVAAGGLYPLTAALLHALVLPGAVLGGVLVLVAARRPELGVGVALFLPALPPGHLGSLAWMAGIGWIGLLAFLLLFRRADGHPGEARRVFGHRRLPPLGLLAALFVVATAAGFALGGLAAPGVPVIRSVATGGLLLVVAATALRTRRQVFDALAGVSAGGILVGGLATIELLTGVGSNVGFITSTGELVWRVTAGIGHPNMLGGFLMVVVPLAVAGAMADRRWRLLHATAAVLALLGIYASFSRGALLALAVMPFVLLRGRSFLLLVPAVAVVLAVGVPSVLQERFAAGGGSGGSELASRADFWDVGLTIWADRPVVGVGVGTFPEAYAEARVVDKGFLPNTALEPPPHAHNLAIHVLAEQGLVGLVLLGAILATAVRRAARVRRVADPPAAILASGMLAAIAGFLVHNLFEVTLLENTGIQVWGMLGILAAFSAVELEEPLPNAV